MVVCEARCLWYSRDAFSCRGSQPNRYLPQAILDSKGNPLDPHIVLNELVNDGDELNIEYSDGPLAFTTRYAGKAVLRLAAIFHVVASRDVKRCVSSWN